MAGIDEGEHPGTPRRKHRHDLGQEDHGPALAAGTTRAIQTLLGLWIVLTLAMVVYALADSARPRSQPVPLQGAAGRSEVPAAGSPGQR